MGPTGTGKTSILLRLQHPDKYIKRYITPTYGCHPLIMIRPPRLLSGNEEGDGGGRGSAGNKRLHLSFFDTCDKEEFVVFNTSFLRQIHGIIFVVDSSLRDRESLEQYTSEAKRSLSRAISTHANTLQDQPVLVFVNKQDHVGDRNGPRRTGVRMTAQEVVEVLDLETLLKGRRSLELL
ncbi:MAG: P-loop containing nucleoside triphosphate hydrolase protein [Linnemannia gamsii]|nr:MAG: P-loop containing nucleoside triphosphate hydrolase protein [Linnemannia gamsii]